MCTQVPSSASHSLCVLTHSATFLPPGGYFIGTIPMGPRVEELLGKRPELRTPMLRLVRKWKVWQRWTGTGASSRVSLRGQEGPSVG